MKRVGILIKICSLSFSQIIHSSGSSTKKYRDAREGVKGIFAQFAATSALLPLDNYVRDFGWRIGKIGFFLPVFRRKKVILKNCMRLINDFSAELMTLLFFIFMRMVHRKGDI